MTQGMDDVHACEPINSNILRAHSAARYILKYHTNSPRAKDFAV